MLTIAVVAPILITLAAGTVSALSNKGMHEGEEARCRAHARAESRPRQARRTLTASLSASCLPAVLYETPVLGKCGVTNFQKAYFLTLAMFIGEALCLLIYFVKKHMAARRVRHSAGDTSYLTLTDGGSPDYGARSNSSSSVNGAESPMSMPLAGENTEQSLGSSESVSTAKPPPVWVYAVLSCFDLSATAIAGVGLIWVDASTNQMLRGSMVVFCAIFSVMLLNRKLSRGQWTSIGVVCLGLAIVGSTGMLQKHFAPPATDDSNAVSSGQLLIGIVLVLLASAINAIQNVIEEKLLKASGGADVDPLMLVG
jgi:drug/metabolite transporter (DMT)-like permease